MHFLETLSPAQKEAATYINGPLLIIAGAGAGKTKTITARIAHIIEGGVAPDSILAVTFTNKAAKEMRERVHKLLGSMHINASPVMMTFHSLGVSILREHGHLLGLKRGFAIMDEDDVLVLIKECLKVLDISPKEYDPKFFRSVISRERQDGVTCESYDAAHHGQKGYLVKQVWRLYNEKKVLGGGVDFDDLLTMPIEMLKKHSNIRELYNKRFNYIHVDEYQDVNDLQVEMIELLLGPHKNICVVGDADQTIYSWRGSKIEHIMQYEKKFAPTHVVMLEENYRSSKIILDAANEVVKKNKNRVPKNLYTNRGGGEVITVLECVDEYDEAKTIVNKVQDVIDRGVKPTEIAILYRANFQSRVLEEAFLGSGIPYTMLGTRFFDRREVKDVLAFIRSAMNRNSIPDFTRAISSVPRGIGKTTLAKVLAGDTSSLTAKASASLNNFYNLLDRINLVIDGKTASEALIYTIRESGLEEALRDEGPSGYERIENIKELASLAANYDSYGSDGMMLFLEHAALYDNDVVNQGKPEGVMLMTVHSAKGLEWDTVFITGLEQFLFPHVSESSNSLSEQEEERRLMYVAITRAKRKLYLSYAQLRTIFGQKKIESPSEFLYDIPDDVKEIVQSWSSSRERVVYLD